MPVTKKRMFNAKNKFKHIIEPKHIISRNNYYIL